jgi:hypothetical protein
VNEHPILFSSSMVRAILAGTKTQTRRIVGTHAFRDRAGVPLLCSCPYGAPGDRLWVRERARVLFVDVRSSEVGVRREADGAEERVPYPARLAAPRVGKCLAYGYREASRIDLELLAVRVERLQDIPLADIAAEGVAASLSLAEADGLLRGIQPLLFETRTRNAWSAGWDAINGKRASWASNPWVWVLTFKRVRP